MNLYLDELPEFAKEAAFAARLSETPENWPQELTSELYKQLPFLSDYDVNVNLDRVDGSRGFAFGYADISSKTERPEVEHSEMGIPHIRIPLVVKERACKPFSIFLDGEKVIPLTEERIREALFNPATFDLSGTAPRDPSLVEPLMPPQRSGIGMGGEYKMASAPENELYVALEGKQKKAERAMRCGSVAVSTRKEKKASDLTEEERAAYRRALEKWRKTDAFQRVTNSHGAKIVGGALVGGMIGGARGGGTPQAVAAGALGGIGGAYLGNSVGTRAADAMVLHSKTIRDAAARNNPEFTRILKKEMASGKEKRSSLLGAIAPTINERDAQRFIEKVANDATTQAGFRRSGIAPTLVEVFDHTKRASADERLDALADQITPTAVTFHKLPGGNFLVKSACVDAFVEKTAEGEVVPQQDAAQAIGPQNAQAMQPGQTATAVIQPVPEQATQPEMPKARAVSEFGQYKVYDSMGNALLGHVFPTLLDWDGMFSQKPIALFTNGSAYALQDHVSGELVGKGTTLPEDEPRGDGAFYHVDGGDAIATSPITIHSTVSGIEGARLMCSDVFGRQFQLSQMEGLKEPQRISDTEYAIPDSWKFMRLNNQIEVCGDPDEQQAAPAVKQASVSAELFFNGSFHLCGGCGLEKISTSLYQDMDPVHAEFMLGVLGVDGVTAKMKVAQARCQGCVKLANLKTITTLGERYSSATKTAAALLSEMPDLRRDLVKVAASLEDEGTVDNLLALNFINPENLATFVGYLPNLEETSEKLAEMLLYSYLGQKEIQEGPVEHAMKSLEEVIVGLKSLEQ